MALLDRIKDATKPTNTVEEVKQRQDQTPPPDLHRASPAGPSVAPQGEGRKVAADPKIPAYATEPEAIRRAYYVEEQGSQRRYYDDYKKTALAIRADDTTISSKREDLTTIRAILTLAESRGWQEVKVNGSAEFKREAWIEAAARGITAQGYKASDLDRQEADRRRAEQGPSVRPPSQTPERNEVREATARTTPAPSPLTPAAPAPAPAPQAPAQQPSLTERQAPGSPTPRAPVADKPEAGPKLDPAAAPAQQQDAAAPKVDHRKALREATAELSQDGRLVLAAVSAKIDREINKVGNEGKAELKAYFAAELLKKEKAEGPVVLSPEQKRAAAAPEPVQQQQKAPEPERQAERQPPRRAEPEEPRRTRRR